MNRTINLSEGNTVLKDNSRYGFLIFNLLAKTTCPYSTNLCKKICYGRNSQELFKPVYNSRNKNYKESFKSTFKNDMIDIIKENLKRKKYKDKKIIFRWHETGDFYSQEYFDTVISICNFFKNNKNIIFQAYTKSLPFVVNSKIKEKNIKFIFSVMEDTKQENIDLAKTLGLNLFYAVPEEIYNKIEKKYKCKGNCGICKSCYLKNQDMYVLYHGVHAPKRKTKIELDKTLYWRKKYKKDNF